MSRQRGLLTIAIGALSIGVLVYVFDQQPEFIYFLPGWLSYNDQMSNVFGSLGNSLPTFLHVYAFILLTLAIAAPSITKVLPICLAWFCLDSLFELAQIDAIAQWIAAHSPTSFTGILFLENASSYFLLGTFDVIDLLSIVTGTVAAYLTVTVLTRRVSL